MDTHKHLLLRILTDHRGPENRISREDLCAELERQTNEPIGDRRMRMMLEELRYEDPRGSWICAHLSGGYFIARDEKELDEFIGSDERRAMNTLSRVRNQRKNAGLQNTQQLRMPLEA